MDFSQRLKICIRQIVAQGSGAERERLNPQQQAINNIEQQNQVDYNSYKEPLNRPEQQKENSYNHYKEPLNQTQQQSHSSYRPYNEVPVNHTYHSIDQQQLKQMQLKIISAAPLSRLQHQSYYLNNKQKQAQIAYIDVDAMQQQPTRNNTPRQFQPRKSVLRFSGFRKYPSKQQPIFKYDYSLGWTSEKIDKIDTSELIQKLNLANAGEIKEWNQSDLDPLTVSKLMQSKTIEKFNPKSHNIVHRKHQLPNSTFGQPSFHKLLFSNQSYFNQISGKHWQREQRGKVAKKGGKQPVLNVGGLGFKALGTQCYQKGILNDQMFSSFSNYNSDHKIKGFVRLFDCGKIQNKHFANKQLTIMDHRRMCDYLVKLYPDQYDFTELQCQDPLLFKFLYNLYELRNTQYKSLVDSLDATSKVTWWNNIQHNYQQKLTSGMPKLPKYGQKLKPLAKMQMNFDSNELGLDQGRKSNLGKHFFQQYDQQSSQLSSEQSNRNNNKSKIAGNKKIFK